VATPFAAAGGGGGLSVPPPAVSAAGAAMESAAAAAAAVVPVLEQKPKKDRNGKFKLADERSGKRYVLLIVVTYCRFLFNLLTPKITNRYLSLRFF